jgi:hypothetical protein
MRYRLEQMTDDIHRVRPRDVDQAVGRFLRQASLRIDNLLDE